MIPNFIWAAALASRGAIVGLLINIIESAYHHGKDAIASEMIKIIPGLKESATHDEMVELVEAGEYLYEKLKAVLD